MKKLNLFIAAVLISAFASAQQKGGTAPKPTPAPTSNNTNVSAPVYHSTPAPVSNTGTTGGTTTSTTDAPAPNVTGTKNTTAPAPKTEEEKKPAPTMRKFNKTAQRPPQTGTTEEKK